MTPEERRAGYERWLAEDLASIRSEWVDAEAVGDYALCRDLDSEAALTRALLGAVRRGDR